MRLKGSVHKVDIFTPPSFSEGNYMYAFIMMYLFMLGAWLTVNYLRKENKKVEEEEARRMNGENLDRSHNEQ